MSKAGLKATNNELARLREINAELLAACKSVLPALYASDDECEHPITQESIRMIESAIAKAESL